jgi:preprotein translocase subunit SecE
MSSIRNYLSEVFIELRKANWPWNAKEKGFAKYKELTDHTMIVLVAMVLLGAFVSVFDVTLRDSFRALVDWASK